MSPLTFRAIRSRQNRSPVLRRIAVLLGLIAVATPLLAGTAVEGGTIPLQMPLFPTNNWWNTEVANAPVDTNSDAILTWIGKTKGMHPDFGGDAGGGDVYGFPFIIVDGSQTKKTVDFSPGWPDQSDGVNHDTNTSYPFYPVPDEAITMNGWVEGGQPGNVDQRDIGDRHILIVDKTNNYLYELYNVWYNGTNWEAASGAFFDMNTNNRRTEGWTSADAAGMAMLPGLVRYDEANGTDAIRHAFRLTLRACNNYVFPASHEAGTTSGAPPLGLRLRLRADKDISSYPAYVQRIFQAMKTYGLIFTDNGSDMYVSGTYDTRWDNDVLNPAFGALKVSDFEVIQEGWAPSVSLVISFSDASTAKVTAYDSNYNVATGYRGTIHFTSTDGAATLPSDYTFTAADAGVHTFSGGFTMRTSGSQIVRAADNSDATIYGWCRYLAPPTNVVATAATSTHVDVTWTASGGAASYEVYRASAGSGGYVSVGTTSSPSYGETVTAGGAYAYKVRAIDASYTASPFSTPDCAAARTFTDDPLVIRSTRVKAAHVNELRDAVNALRSAAGLTPTTFTDTIVAGGQVVKAMHMTQLRTALAKARAALGLTTVSYTDASIVSRVSPVKEVDVRELRNGVK